MKESFFIPLDHAILMHRDVHFNGSFEAMIHYYEKEGEGVCQEFPLERLIELARYEEEQGENIAPLFLFPEEKEQVDEAIKAYKYLHALQKMPHKENPVPQLTANLILAENELQIENVILDLSKHSDKALKSMLDLLKNDQMHDPLFPGYGLAPMRAAQVIGRLGDKRAIISLFEAIGHEEDFFDEEILLSALKSIGTPAKEFLLRLAKRSPIDPDSEKAIIALSAFKGDSDVAQVCLELLSRQDVRHDPIIFSYLIFNCEGLIDTSLRDKFSLLTQDPALSKQQKLDFDLVIKAWKS